MSVVNNSFEVYGLEGLRLAKASALPRIPLGNTMAPTLIVGAEAARNYRYVRSLTNVLVVNQA